MELRVEPVLSSLRKSIYSNVQAVAVISEPAIAPLQSIPSITENLC